MIRKAVLRSNEVLSAVSHQPMKSESMSVVSTHEICGVLGSVGLIINL